MIISLSLGSGSALALSAASTDSCLGGEFFRKREKDQRKEELSSFQHFRRLFHQFRFLRKGKGKEEK
jgi:hypothetical protein